MKWWGTQLTSYIVPRTLRGQHKRRAKKEKKRRSIGKNALLLVSPYVWSLSRLGNCQERKRKSLFFSWKTDNLHVFSRLLVIPCRSLNNGDRVRGPRWYWQAIKRERKKRKEINIFEREAWILLRCCLPITSHSNWATGLVYVFFCLPTFLTVPSVQGLETGGPKVVWFSFWVSFMPIFIFYFYLFFSTVEMEKKKERKTSPPSLFLLVAFVKPLMIWGPFGIRRVV